MNRKPLTDISEPGCLGATVEVNQASSGSRGKGLGEESPAPAGQQLERKEARLEQTGRRSGKEVLIHQRMLRTSNSSLLPCAFGFGRKEEVGSISSLYSFYDLRLIRSSNLSGAFSHSCFKANQSALAGFPILLNYLKSLISKMILFSNLFLFLMVYQSFSRFFFSYFNLCGNTVLVDLFI